MTPPIRLHRSAAAAAAAAGLLILVAAACQGGVGGSKAERIFRDKTADAQVAEYAFAIAAGTPSAAERQVMIEALNGDQYDTALAAAQALVDSDDPAVKEAMRKAFEDKRGAIKLHAAMSLARDGDEQAKQWLLG